MENLLQRIQLCLPLLAIIFLELPLASGFAPSHSPIWTRHTRLQKAPSISKSTNGLGVTGLRCQDSGKEVSVGADIACLPWS